MDDRLIVYGAGNELINLVKAGLLKDDIDLLIDGDLQKVGKNIYGLKVSNKSVLIDLAEDTQVYISSEQYYYEIERDIIAVNSKLSCGHLIDAVIEKYPVIGRCNLCGRNVRYWREIGESNQTKFRITGNGSRKGGCPYCGSSDRNRFVYYVLQKYTTMFCNPSRVLHVAPEMQLYDKFKQLSNIEYYPGDIRKRATDYVVDVTNIQFKDDYFDYVVINHVFEHIINEKKAIQELMRIIKPMGKIIFSVPISWDCDTHDSSDNGSEISRIYEYGQKDHVRLYGKDIVQHFERYGLSIVQIQAKPEESIAKYGIINMDSVFIASPKPGAGKCLDQVDENVTELRSRH